MTKEARRYKTVMVISLRSFDWTRVRNYSPLALTLNIAKEIRVSDDDAITVLVENSKSGCALSASIVQSQGSLSASEQFSSQLSW